jgi:hypothetical protein
MNIIDTHGLGKRYGDTWPRRPVLREHYVPSVVTSSPAFESGPITPQDPWVLAHWFVGGTRWTRYIPVSRFWPMQFVEGGWLLVLSVLLAAATVWLVRRRAA